MPSLQQPLAYYHVHFVHNRSLGQPPLHTRMRFIQFRFGVPSSGQPWGGFTIRFVADGSASTGTLTKNGGGAYEADVRVPVGEYADYADLLRNEQPVLVWIDYDTEPAVGQTVSIKNWSLSSGNEPLGEGPKDTSGPGIQ